MPEKKYGIWAKGRIAFIVPGEWQAFLDGVRRDALELFRNDP